MEGLFDICHHKDKILLQLYRKQRTFKRFSLSLDFVYSKGNPFRGYFPYTFRIIITQNIFQVLLVTSSRRPELWIVPGGGVEPEEEPSVTAVREVLEEAGVVGSLGRCLGVFEVRLAYTLRIEQD